MLGEGGNVVYGGSFRRDGVIRRTLAIVLAVVAAAAVLSPNPASG